MALREEPVGVLLVEIHALALKGERAVVGDAEPRKTIDDVLCENIFGPFPVSVLDPQYERAVVMAGEEPVEEGRPGRPRYAGFPSDLAQIVFLS